VRDKRGQYPLHRAAAVGSVPMLNLLIKHRSPIDATDSAGQTALHHAIAEGHGMFSPFSLTPSCCVWAMHLCGEGSQADGKM
jgi:ankyrin repeat protein